MNAAVPGLGNMFVAGVYRAVFRDDLEVDEINHSNKARNYTDAFRQYSFINETNLSCDGNVT